MSAPVPPHLVAMFLDLAIAGEQREAVRLTIDLLDDGVPTEAIVTDLLGAAQIESGERWRRGEWSIADEHLVTGVSHAALEALHTSAVPPEPEGLAVVACAEGDWHALPAQMFAESLRARGHGVLFLGASTPAEEVSDFISRRDVDALTVTCNLAFAYQGTARLVDAAHRQGVPVIAGGAALTAERAAVLGADAWAPDVDAAAEILRSWRDEPPRIDPAPVRLDPAARALESRSSGLALRALDALEEQSPASAAADDPRRARLHEDLVYLVRYLAAARLVDDPEVLRLFAQELQDRGVASHELAGRLTTLAPLLAEIDEGAACLALDEAHRLAGSTSDAGAPGRR